MHWLLLLLLLLLLLCAPLQPLMFVTCAATLLTPLYLWIFIGG
jgi:hypothetical protein